ncbi:MAG: hypothetical protein LBE83_00600 [Propionibacteriaceae bacterium]|nr:hypothetical protein [Propionibacteriaceae bacterium]
MRRSFGLATWVAVVMVLGVTLSSCGYSPTKGSITSATFSDNGQTAYVAYYLYTPDSRVYVEAVDVANNRSNARTKVPASFSETAWVYSHGENAVMLVPRDRNKDGLTPIDVYLIAVDGKPHLVSENQILQTSSSDAFFWHNTIVFIGADAGGNPLLMYIAIPQYDIIFVPLLDREGFAAGISDLGFYTYPDSHMAAIVVGLYDNSTVYISPFLARGSMPLFWDSSSDGDNAEQAFARQYYGDHNLLRIVGQNDNSSRLVKAPIGSSRNDGIPVVSQVLYRAVCFSQDATTQLVLGYTGPNPNQASVTGYLYDIPSETLTQLPILDNFEISKVVTVIASTEDHLVLGLGYSRTVNDALLISLVDGTSLKASAILDTAGSPPWRWNSPTTIILILAALVVLIGFAKYRRRSRLRGREPAIGAEAATTGRPASHPGAEYPYESQD